MTNKFRYIIAFLPKHIAIRVEPPRLTKVANEKRIIYIVLHMHKKRIW